MAAALLRTATRPRCSASGVSHPMRSARRALRATRAAHGALKNHSALGVSLVSCGFTRQVCANLSEGRGALVRGPRTSLKVMTAEIRDRPNPTEAPRLPLDLNARLDSGPKAALGRQVRARAAREQHARDCCVSASSSHRGRVSPRRRRRFGRRRFGAARRRAHGFVGAVRV